MKDLILYVTQALVTQPDEVSVTESEEGGTTVYHLHVAPDDMGKVIGRQGRIANALRALLKASAARQNRRAILEIV
ncbi:MAG: KH domain-containing protein [Chloroflexota bacterium]